MLYAVSITSPIPYAQVLVSISNSGYTVRYGLGWRDERIELGDWGWLGAACDWDARAAIRIRKPQRRLGEFYVMLVRPSMMPLIQWGNIPCSLSARGGGVTRAELDDLLDFIFLLTLSLLFFP